MTRQLFEDPNSVTKIDVEVTGMIQRSSCERCVSESVTRGPHVAVIAFSRRIDDNIDLGFASDRLRSWTEVLCESMVTRAHLPIKAP